MRKPDKEVWNRQTLLAVAVECAIMLNIDVYGSSYTLWMKLQGQASLITLVATVVTFTSFIGYALVGVLVDRFGTKAVQLSSLVFLLMAGIGVAVADGWYALSGQILRFFLCGVLMIANDTQLRGLLPEGDRKVTGVGKLKAVGTLVSIAGVSTGSMLVSEHREVWNCVGPIAATIGIIFMLISKQSNHVPEHASIFPHKEVFRLVLPVIGIAVCVNVLTTYIIIDLGVRDGSLVRTVTYIGASISGWLLACLFKRHISEKNFIRTSVSMMAGAMLMLIWANVIVLTIASLIIGITYHGVFNQILGAKAFDLTDQKGRAASTSIFIYGVGGIVGVNCFGLVREQMGSTVMYLSLAGLMLISLPLFEWTFRTSIAWKKVE